MGFQFTADRAGRAAIMEFIFSRTTLQVYDSYSPHGEEIRQYTDSNAIEKTLAEAPGKTAQFAMYSPDFGGDLIFRRIALKPEMFGEGKFRYCLEGWGLIYLIFVEDPQSVVRSDINSNSEKRAHTWFVTYPEWGSPSVWNWKEIERVIRQLRYQIKNRMKL